MALVDEKQYEKECRVHRRIWTGIVTTAAFLCGFFSAVTVQPEVSEQDRTQSYVCGWKSGSAYTVERFTGKQVTNRFETANCIDEDQNAAARGFRPSPDDRITSVKGK